MLAVNRTLRSEVAEFYVGSNCWKVSSGQYDFWFSTHGFFKTHAHHMRHILISIEHSDLLPRNYLIEPTDMILPKKAMVECAKAIGPRLQTLEIELSVFSPLSGRLAVLEELRKIVETMMPEIMASPWTLKSHPVFRGFDSLIRSRYVLGGAGGGCLIIPNMRWAEIVIVVGHEPMKNDRQSSLDSKVA